MPKSMSRPNALILLAHAYTRMREFLRAQLASRYRVEVANGCRQAWERVNENDPDLLIADAKLPVSDERSPEPQDGGFLLCRKVKETPEIDDFPVILLAKEEPDGTEGLGADDPVEGEERPEETGPVSIEGWELEEASEARPDVILTKPFDVGALRRCVWQLLAGRAPQASPADEDIFERVLHLIDERLGDPDLSVGDLADAVNLSRRHLARRIKQATGLTPAAVLRTRRIEAARRRLRDQETPIQDVAQAVGFRSPSHFSQVFGRQVGCSPSTYRDRHAS